MKNVHVDAVAVRTRSRAKRLAPILLLASGLVGYVAAQDRGVQREPSDNSQPGQNSQVDSALQRGLQTFQSNCSFCHGIDARGGAQGGVDLVASPLVRQDQAGKQLADFLKVGRPEKGMPKFALDDSAVADISAFLHSRISAAAAVGGRGGDPRVIVVGDAKAGEKYFNGVGHCTNCHSVAGDLKGIGAKYDPRTLQNRMVLTRGRGGFFSQGSPEPARTVTVTSSPGSSVSGTLLSISDFDLTLIDSSGVRRTFSRDGDVPNVVIHDPLQFHFELLQKYTDKSIHDLTAYLVTLK